MALPPISRRFRVVPLRPHVGRQFGFREVLAQLQSADVGGDGPAVARWHLLLVVGHRAVAIGDDVEKMADGDLAQPVNVVRRRRRIAALDDLAVSPYRAASWQTTQ